MTQYQMLRETLNTPDFSRDSRSVRKLMSTKAHVMQTEQPAEDKKQQIANRVIEVVEDEVNEKMALRRTAAMYKMNRFKLQATAMSKDKGITLQEKTRLAIKLMDGVKFRERKDEVSPKQ